LERFRAHVALPEQDLMKALIPGLRLLRPSTASSRLPVRGGHPAAVDLRLRLSLIVALICLVLITFSRAQGGTVDSLAGLIQCEEGPCFRGLKPGTSTWDEALALAGGEPRNFSDAAYSSIILFASLDGRTLDAVLLKEPRDPQIRVGTVLARFGRPTCAQFYPGNGQMVLHYPALHITTRFEGSHFRPHSPVISIMVGHGSASSANEGFICDLQLSMDIPEPRIILDWQGFVPQWRYLSRPS
jgi:hypothetical protein